MFHCRRAGGSGCEKMHSLRTLLYEMTNSTFEGFNQFTGTFSSSAILFISASPALPSFLSSFLAKSRAFSLLFCSASLNGGA